MYPFKVILIGDDEQLLPHVRRELLNQSAEIDNEFRNIASATEQLTLQHDDARLFVIHVDDLGQLENLKRLSGAFASRPIVVLLNGDADKSFVVNVMRCGASQVVMLPLSVAEFTEALDAVLVQFGHLASRTQVIAVTSAHGGVGSTSLAVDLAFEMAQKFQLDTILLELQLNFGMLATFLGIEPRHTTDQLLEMGYAMDLYAIKNALVPFGDRLSILSGPLHIKSPTQVENGLITHLIQSVSHLADVVVLDVPSTMDNQQLELLNAADKVVLVAEQTVPSLQLTIEILQLGLRAHSPSIVINRYDSSLEGFDVGHIRGVLGIDDVRTVVNDNVGFHAARNQGQPLRLASPKSKAIKDIDVIAENLLSTKHACKANKPREGIIGRLTQMLGME
jgi:pilus assembly protein CpaE